MLDPQQEIKRRTGIASLWALLAIGAGVTAVSTVMNAPLRNGIPSPLRTVLDTNARIASTLSSNNRTAENYSRDKGEKPRFNGTLGLGSPIDVDAWRLHIEGGSADNLTIDDIKKLPSIEYTTKFKCVEGWSQIVNAKGVRFSEFLKAYGPKPGVEPTEADLPKWAGLETPDHQYYVGVDMKSMLHPQTILCYEMDGKPLTMEHGAPLRLLIPIKYGIKSLKRLGTLTLTNDQPRDYWFERGYDYYAGH